MKKKKIIKYITFLLVVLMIMKPSILMGPWLYFKYEVIGLFVDIKYEMIEAMNRKENEKIAKDWLKSTYGATISEATSIKFSNRGQGWSTHSIFHMEAPFASGSIFVDSKTKEVDGGFNLQGEKFLHLYSEWVKKQVGIEDENVELVIGFNKDNMDFKKIAKLSEDCREIFENIKSYSVSEVYVKNVKEANNNTIKGIATYYYKVYFVSPKSNFPYFVTIIRDDCDLLQFIADRKGEYYSCWFENGILTRCKYFCK